MSQSPAPANGGHSPSPETTPAKAPASDAEPKELWGTQADRERWVRQLYREMDTRNRLMVRRHRTK
jgi:hypothetical protein